MSVIINLSVQVCMYVCVNNCFDSNIDPTGNASSNSGDYPLDPNFRPSTVHSSSPLTASVNTSKRFELDRGLCGLFVCAVDIV